MIICPQCTHLNPEGTLFCEECGEPFVVVSSVETVAIKRDSADQTPDSITIEIQGHSRQFTVSMMESPVILGRADYGANFIPEIELTPFNAVALGVSRRHALISWGAMGVTVEDLGSYNGTFVNGRRLAPNERYTLQDNDEITLGNLVLYVRFNRD